MNTNDINVNDSGLETPNDFNAIVEKVRQQVLEGLNKEKPAQKVEKEDSSASVIAELKKQNEEIQKKYDEAIATQELKTKEDFIAKNESTEEKELPDDDYNDIENYGKESLDGLHAKLEALNAKKKEIVIKYISSDGIMRPPKSDATPADRRKYTAALLKIGQIDDEINAAKDNPSIRNFQSIL